MAAKRSAIFFTCAGDARSAASPVASISTPVRSSSTLRASREQRVFVEIDAEGPPHLLGDEGADALARDHQPVGAQGGDRLADHGAGNAGGRDHFLLGGQALSRRELAAGDIGGEARHEFRRQPARGSSGCSNPRFFVARLPKA